MINQWLMYAANRATNGAVDGVARQAFWAAAAVFMVVSGTAFCLAVAFWLLEERVGAPEAGVILAAGCFALAIVCFAAPRLISQAEKATAVVEPAQQEAAAAQVHEEMSEAVDYFGAARVVGSAFLLGLGLARRVKHPLS